MGVKISLGWAPPAQERATVPVDPGFDGGRVGGSTSARTSLRNSDVIVSPRLKKDKKNERSGGFLNEPLLS